MTDKEIIEIFDNNGKINSNKTRLTWLNKHLDIKEYLEHRYTPFFSHTTTLKFIFAGLLDVPKCENCDKPLDSNRRWCNQKCQLTDPKFIAYRNNTIDYKVKVEKTKQTMLERYGVTSGFKTDLCVHNSHTKEARQKAAESNKLTCLERYGVENTLVVPEIRKKAMQTKLKNRPNDPNNSEKTKQTMLELYGGTATLNSPILKEKVEQTNLKKYGSKNPFGSKEIREKAKLTTIERYSEDPTLFGSNGFKANMKDKYGVEYYCQSKEFNETRRRKYYFDEIGFDSIPEVAFYIYHKDLGHSVKHEPIQFVYYYANKKHIYNPDFEIDGILYEIKGKHFFRDGKMINPFDESQNDLYEAKHQCMKNHSVIIITDFNKYVEYLFNTYKLDNILRKE